MHCRNTYRYKTTLLGNFNSKKILSKFTTIPFITRPTKSVYGQLAKYYVQILLLFVHKNKSNKGTWKYLTCICFFVLSLYLCFVQMQRHDIQMRRLGQEHSIVCLHPLFSVATSPCIYVLFLFVFVFVCICICVSFVLLCHIPVFSPPIYHTPPSILHSAYQHLNGNTFMFIWQQYICQPSVNMKISNKVDLIESFHNILSTQPILVWSNPHVSPGHLANLEYSHTPGAGPRSCQSVTRIRTLARFLVFFLQRKVL